MAKIYIPSTGVDQWQRLLADPEKHWRKGYSARTLAYCWEEEANDFPSSVRAVLDNSGIESLQNLELLLAVPEHQVQLRGGARPSQNGVWPPSPIRYQLRHRRSSKLNDFVRATP